MLSEFLDENVKLAAAELTWMKGKNIRLCKNIKEATRLCRFSDFWNR